MKYILEVEESRLEDALFFIKAFRKVEKSVLDQIRGKVDGKDMTMAYYEVRDSMVEGVNTALYGSGKTQFTVIESGFALEESFHIKQIENS